MRWIAVLLLAGCVGLVQPGASAWTWETSDSMLPDFEGEGEAFPVLAVHKHAEWSQRQKEDFERNPWVCADLAGNEIPIYRPDLGADAAPCEMPPWDAGTGRMLVDPQEFEAWDVEAIALVASCTGGILPLSGPEPGFQFEALEHTFRVEWKGDHFLIDGHRLDKGKVLKATYWVDRGDEMDQRFVRASFDFPGYWLTSNVALDPEHTPASVPGTASIVDDEVLALELAATPDTLGDVLTPLAEAMGEGVRLADASLVIQDGRLTELVAGFRDEERTVRWYMASRDGDTLRVLGNNTEHVGAGIEFGRATREVLERPWERFPLVGADPVATRFVFTGDRAWGLLGGGLVQAAPVPLPCDDCVYVLSDPPLRAPDFYHAPDALEVDGDTPAWRVDHHQADGSRVRGFYVIEAS